MTKARAQTYTPAPVEFECTGCGTVAQTQGLSTPPTGWKRRLSLANWPERCVTWTCAECVRQDTASTEGAA